MASLSAATPLLRDGERRSHNYFTIATNWIPNISTIRATVSRKIRTEGSVSPRLSDVSLESNVSSASTSRPPAWANNDFVSNAIIGFADGLTVPFALTAGLTSFGNQQLVVIGGIAELVAGALSMGLGAYLAASTERTAYLAQEQREIEEVKDEFRMEKQKIEETYAIFDSYGMERERVAPLVDGLRENKDVWVKFLLDHSLKVDKPDVRTAWICAIIMAVAYFIGGIVPMLPYFFVGKHSALHSVLDGLYVSIGISIILLLSFGYVKAMVTGCGRKAAVSSALQTLFVGIVASGTSFGIVWALNHGLSGGGELSR